MNRLSRSEPITHFGGTVGAIDNAGRAAMVSPRSLHLEKDLGWPMPGRKCLPPSPWCLLPWAFLNRITDSRLLSTIIELPVEGKPEGNTGPF